MQSTLHAQSTNTFTLYNDVTLTLVDDCDPDLNFFVQLIQRLTKHLVDGQFDNFIEHNALTKNLKLFHLHKRSLNKNGAALLLFIETFRSNLKQ